MPHEIIITGFHRSGTSMVTQLLHSAGLFVGERLLGAMPSNPYGHFEDKEVVALHDAILRDNGRNWQVAEALVPTIYERRWAAAEHLVRKRRIAHGLWGFKDPRVCHFLAVWKHLMPSAKILIIFRSAVDSAYSLERRHASQMLAGEGPRPIHLRFWREPDLALRMWIAHNEAVLRVAADYPKDVAALSFEVLSQGYPLVDALNGLWRLGLASQSTHAVFDPRATTSRPYPMYVQDEALVPQAMDVWRRLRALERKTLLNKERADARE